jgi:anthranilate/para-aminobenzoate synthase component II
MEFKADFYAAYSISDLAPCMRPICLDDHRVVAFRHKKRRIWGTLFHPESICAHTELILNNFMKNCAPTKP